MSPSKKSSENKSYRKNEAERKRAQREKVKLLYPELHELIKKEERERKQLFRLKKKLGPVNQSFAILESPAAANNNATNTTPLTSFSTKQARARSISRAGKALPKSPRKKAEVLGSLAKKYQLRIVMNKKRGLKAKELTDE